MSLIEFKDLPNTDTPINAENLNHNFNEILNLVCPIGKVEVFFDNNDHSNYLGFVWERTSIGKVPVGIDSSDTDFNTIGKTGGEKEHTLTIDEMPNHKHKLNFGNNSPGDGTALQYSSTEGSSSAYDINGVGGNKPHNILQPYEVMAFWKRIS